MVELLIRPTLHRFETCLDFVKEFHPGERDLVLTNKYIYELPRPDGTSGSHHLSGGIRRRRTHRCDGRRILADAARMGCTRVIAIGGGTVLDIAKVLAVSSGEGVDTCLTGPPPG